MARILIVDDQESVRLSLGMILETQGHACHYASDAEEALLHAELHEYELVLCDVSMPGMSGIELVRVFRQSHPETAIVMVTGLDDPLVADEALDSGAYGYILKPFHPNLIFINVANALRRRQLELENRSYRAQLELTVEERSTRLYQTIARLTETEQELRRSREETIHRLARAAEFRDDETAQHIQRMAHYCALLAELIGLPPEMCELLRIASPMHDVGKIGIPDAILLKPGRLGHSEFQLMKEHAEIGYRILAGSGATLLELAATIARTHHEKWDGSGYPMGLKGTQIPIEGRITAIADVFDALTSRRVYKEAFSVEKALEIMVEGRGAHFDPDLLEIFLQHIQGFLAIREQYRDLTAH